MKIDASQNHTILVTGGAGLIGSNLVKRLRSLGNRVVVVDDLSRGRLEYLGDEAGGYCIDPDRDFHRIDLSVPGAIAPVLEAEKFGYVFHLADVVGGIDYVFGHEGYVFRQNMLINSNVIDAVRRRRRSLEGFIYVGTACSFPDFKQRLDYNKPLTEADQYPASPESAYGWSKLMGEYETLLLEKETGIPVAVLSLHNVYGPPSDYNLKTSQVIPALIHKAITYPNAGFVVWGSGRQGRAFVYVDDVVDALIAAMEKGLGQGLIQIGPDQCTSIREIAEMVVAISAKDIAIQYDASRPEGDEWRFADYTKAKRLLGWSPKTGIREGLERLYAWMEADMLRTAERGRKAVSDNRAR
jgi:GDP-D-mannose 3',5'-epimerase